MDSYLKEQGREDEFVNQLLNDKGYAKVAYPRSANLKERDKKEEAAE